MFTRPHQRPFAWIALVAVLAMALAPTLSHALAFVRGDAGVWAEVCTPQGMRLVVVDAASAVSEPAPVRADAHIEHCPFCALGADAPGLPPAAPVALPQPLLPAFMPPLFLHAPYTPYAWRSAQPRGPPARS